MKSETLFFCESTVISFVEAMSGTVRVPGDGEQPISFELVATRTEHGTFGVRGIVRAPPWAPETTAVGTLTMSVSPRAIAYELTFAGEDGSRLTLVGRKSPSLRRPLTSMTCMPVAIRDAEGRILGEGQMRFHVRDLLPFVASWLPRPRLAQRRLDVRRRALDRRLLGGA